MYLTRSKIHRPDLILPPRQSDASPTRSPIVVGLILLAVLCLLNLLGITGAGIAGATGRDTTANIAFDVPWLTLVAGSIIPLIVGYLTKISTAPGWQGFLNVFFSAVVGGITAVIDNGGTWDGFKVTAAVVAVLGASQISYGVFWKPTGVTKALQRSGPVSDPPHP